MVTGPDATSFAAEAQPPRETARVGVPVFTTRENDPEVSGFRRPVRGEAPRRGDSGRSGAASSLDSRSVSL